MVQLRDHEKWQVKSLESRLSDKFDLLLVAREEENALLFDEFAKSIETYLIAVPEALNTLREEKQEMTEELKKEYKKIEQRMINAPDAITRESIGKQLTQQVDWAFREEYSDVVMEVLYRYNLVPMQLIERTKVQPTYQPTPQKPPEQKPPEPPPAPKQEEVRKKPSLLPQTDSQFE